MYTLDNLQQNKIADLKEIATKLNLKKFQKLNKTDLIYKILDEQATQSTVSSKEVIEKKEDHSGSKKKRERFVKNPKNTSEEKTIEKVENKTTEKAENKTSEKKENIKKESPIKNQQKNNKENQNKKPNLKADQNNPNNPNHKKKNTKQDPNLNTNNKKGLDYDYD
ncbi:MAG: hypothetical protein HOC66_05560, partial [Flavobacteriales bacterium]|nr:hypothetical protein [Flavobacteriales bacterium]